jgi:hypothetical protein
MAASALQKELLKMSISLFDAAPGALYLSYFEELYLNADNSVLAVAEILTQNTVFLGLYPASLSNIDFATLYIERLIGDEAEETPKASAVEWVSGQMDLGASRASVMLSALDVLNSVSPADETWGKAQQALQNQVAAAEYFSVETGQNANDIKLLQEAIGATTSDSSTVPSTPLLLLIANHSQAVKARDAFLVSADGDDDANSSATQISLDAALTAAFIEVDTFVTGDYDDQTPVIKAALINDQQAANSELETFYQGLVNTALNDVDEIPGLTAALATHKTEASALLVAQASLVTTNTALLRALADYGSNNHSAPVINNNGTIAGLIELNNETLVLASNITEASHPGIDSLLAASIAKEAADEILLEVESSATIAAKAIDNLDLNAAAKVALSLLGSKFTQSTPVDIIRPTTLEIDKEVADLALIIAESTVASEVEATTLAQAAFISAKDSYDNEANTNPLIDALNKAQTQADVITKAITDLEAALALQNTAQNNVDTLATLNDAIENAALNFTNIGLSVPQVIEGTATGTDANDIWLVGTSDTVISEFSALDSLYLESDYALNRSTIAGGNSADSLLEMWLTEESGNSVLTLESTMLGGSADPQATFSITLTGVALADIQLVDNFITLT